LTDGAISILNRYRGKETADGHVFDVPSNQKLNDAIKDAAKAAGLNRVIVETYFVGNKRMEEQHQFCDIISCHDARRTFVSCSLAMSIPAQVVMKCTGHKGYNTMKPYIETATETQTLEMEKWNRSQYRSQIISLLDNANEDLLKNILEYVKKAV
jgi:integrase